MSANLATCDALDFRDAERLRAVDQMSDLFAELSKFIEDQVSQARAPDLARFRKFSNKQLFPVLDERLHASLQSFVSALNHAAREDILKSDPSADPDRWNLQAIAGFAGGSALVLAPIAAMPFLGSLVVTTSTTFLVFTTSTVSVPAIALIATGSAVAITTGVMTQSKTLERVRRRHADRIKSKVHRQIFGDPTHADLPSMRSIVFDMIESITDERTKPE